MSEGMLRSWIEPPALEVPPDLQQAVGGHPLVAQVLTRRGLADVAAARAFLDPTAYTPAPPETLPDMLKACERIERAIRKEETILVWGDFDVDGQTSTTLLVSALRGLGARVRYYIPVRARESHGVHWETLKPLLDEGASLVLTCDTGISSNEALEKARQQGIDVIVTDHHDLPETLPEVYAAINPKLVPGEHALSGLPGVGVAYKLVEALYTRAGRDPQGFLDLAALGIVADLAVQTRDTRWLLQRGLATLRETQRTGLLLMFELAGLQAGNLTEEHIGFVIGPRLNALGRLDDANPIVEFLTTADPGRARVLATHLEGLNARRRLLTDQVLRGAQAQIEKDPRLLESAALVLAHPEWPAGVIGIVASELAERYNRPTILLANPPGQPARGSARSIEGVHITEAIASQKHLLLGFGGHPMAAGMALNPENLPAFRRGVARFVEKALGGAAPRPTLPIDGELTLDSLSLNLVADLERLAPFGPGNPALTLAIRRLTILSSATIGRDGDHLQVVVKDEHDRSRKVVWWRGAGWPLPEGVFDLACVVRASNYRGQPDVQVQWVDARPVESDSIDLRRRPSTAVIDQRDQTHPLPVLQGMLAETAASEKASTLAWAEAAARDKLAALCINACDRSQLTPAETLLIWSTPPGRAELQAALETVRPSTVVVFAVDPGDSTPEAFLKRLAGLVKYAIDKMNGPVALKRLAAATAQREAAVKLGLQWLEARGMVQVTWLAGGEVLLQSGTGKQNPVTDTITGQIKVLLEETAAYRNYFKTADKERLIN